MQQKLMNNPESGVFYSYAEVRSPKSFLQYLQVLSNRTANSIEQKAFIVYSGHVLLMKWSAKYPHWLWESRRPVVGSLPVRRENDLKISCLFMKNCRLSNGLQRKMMFKPKKPENPAMVLTGEHPTEDAITALRYIGNSEPTVRCWIWNF